MERLFLFDFQEELNLWWANINKREINKLCRCYLKILNNKIKKQNKFIRSQLHSELIKTFNEFILKGTKPLANTFSERVSLRITEPLANTLSEQVSLKIIGESYYRWNAITAFWPTIVFLFKEMDNTLTGIFRRTQIKLRLNKNSDEISMDDIESLQSRINTIVPFGYDHGAIRANFISKDKRTKTTVFVNERFTAIKILEKLCLIVDIPFAIEDISFTEGRLRSSATRRSSPLGNHEIAPDLYNANYKVSLYRVALLINGLADPIILYRSY